MLSRTRFLRRYPLNMTRTGVDQLLFLMDQAFEEKEQHALLKNLQDVRDDDWTRVPHGGARSIAEIAQHVGDCKRMYANHAFDDGQMTWHEVASRWQSLPPKSEMVDWLREGHAYLRGFVDHQTDDELMVLRKANWGAMHETRWLISTMIEHDLYHAGEINHIRAVLQSTDAWPTYDD